MTAALPASHAFTRTSGRPGTWSALERIGLGALTHGAILRPPGERLQPLRPGCHAQGTQRSAKGVTCSSCVVPRAPWSARKRRPGELARVGKRLGRLPGRRSAIGSMPASTIRSATWMPCSSELERSGVREGADAERAGRPEPAPGHRPARGALPSPESPSRAGPGRAGTLPPQIGTRRPRARVPPPRRRTPRVEPRSSRPPPNGPVRSPPYAEAALTTNPRARASRGPLEHPPDALRVGDVALERQSACSRHACERPLGAGDAGEARRRR